MTENEFHAKRRMFAVIDGTVLIAPANYPYSHAEWLMGAFGSEKGQELISRHVRGYVYNERLVVYIGQDFSHRVNHKDVLAAVAILEKLYTIKVIGFGAIPGPSQPWEAKTEYDLEDYRERLGRHG